MADAKQAEWVDGVVAAVRRTLEEAVARGDRIEFEEEAGIRDVGAVDGFVRHEWDGTRAFTIRTRPGGGRATWKAEAGPQPTKIDADWRLKDALAALVAIRDMAEAAPRSFDPELLRVIGTQARETLEKVKAGGGYVCAIDAAHVRLRVGTLEVECPGPGSSMAIGNNARVTLDGRPVAVRSIEVRVAVGEAPRVLADIVPVPQPGGPATFGDAVREACERMAQMMRVGCEGMQEALGASGQTAAPGQADTPLPYSGLVRVERPTELVAVSIVNEGGHPARPAEPAPPPTVADQCAAVKARLAREKGGHGAD